jgi:diaminopimelate decarboxylase
MMPDADSQATAGGPLRVEDVPVAELAARFGTPLYVVSEARLRDNARRIREAFKAAWPHGPVRVLPALKANHTVATRLVLSEEGMGCDTFGETEFEVALRGGVPAGLISVNGSSKSRSLIARAVRAGARVTLDSARELDHVVDVAHETGLTARVRLRVRPRLTGIEAPSDFLADEVPIRQIGQAYKPGIPPGELAEVARRALAAPGVDLIGLHVHFARQTTDLEVWRSLVGSFVEQVAELVAALPGWRPRELDLGGGFATPRDPTGRAFSRGRDRPAAPSIEAHALVVGSALADGLREHGIDPAGTVLEVEPGRALYADTGVHLARVRNVKRQTDPEPRVWVETDTSEQFLLDTIIEGVRWTVLVDGRDEPASLTADITGISCGFDCIVPDAQLPATAVGDLLVFLDTGAYQEACATNFNGLPRPAMVLVRGGDAFVIRRRETIDDVLARDLIPAHLTREAS